jgi:hypothetical protein
MPRKAETALKTRRHRLGGGGGADRPTGVGAGWSSCQARRQISKKLVLLSPYWVMTL